MLYHIIPKVVVQYEVTFLFSTTTTGRKITFFSLSLAGGGRVGEVVVHLVLQVDALFGRDLCAVKAERHRDEVTVLLVRLEQEFSGNHLAVSQVFHTFHFCRPGRAKQCERNSEVIGEQKEQKVVEVGTNAAHDVN